jgi:multisubunit Na+/H+ antiporter MnhG subunit
MKNKKRVFYVLLTLLSLQMTIVGVLKLVGFPPLYQQLDELHISHTFGFAIGMVEVLCVAGIWIRKTRGIALLTLLFLVTSAMAVHFGASVEITKAIPAMVSLTLVITLLVLNNTNAVMGILKQNEGV